MRDWDTAKQDFYDNIDAHGRDQKCNDCHEKMLTDEINPKTGICYYCDTEQFLKDEED